MVGAGIGGVNVKRSYSAITTGAGAANMRKASPSVLCSLRVYREGVVDVSRARKVAQVSLTP